MSRREEIAQAIKDREWWEDLGKRLELGRLTAFTYKRSALFDNDGLTISVDGPILDVLLRLNSRLKGEGE